jgi:hypothetical protein
LEPTPVLVIPSGKLQQGIADMTDMEESLLDECHESIVKIAETQAPDGRRAILAMAENFCASSGRVSSGDQPSSSLQGFPPASSAA